MTVVKFSRVISCSSEDPKYPATNLLKLEPSRPWKCKERGEKQVVVILELEKVCKIESIDIGNENSAFIEIFVGKSATPDTYEILRVASLLMSVQDSKDEKNKNVVRFFKQEEFSKPASNQLWDRIKITCTQPFNKNVQYGLSFVRVHSSDGIEKNEKNNADSLALEKYEDTKSEKCDVSMLGKFALKKETDASNEVAVGSLFARRNEEPLSAAVAIRAASNNPTSIINATKRLSDLVPNIKDTKRKRKNDEDVSNLDYCRRSIAGPLLYSGDLSDDELDTRINERDFINSKENSKQNSTTETKREKTKGKNVELEKTSQSLKISKWESSISSEKDSINKTVKKKPFHRLLEGVVFVISGYQNPYRSELRSKALSMGARYKANWNSECTHLICAFSNTPKLAQVRGNGWIVQNTWIEDCYAMRKRLPCVNYKLNVNDPYTNSDDEEIWEDIPDTTTVSVPKEPERIVNNGCSSLHDSRKSISLERETEENDIYNADTDVDSDQNSTVMQFNHEIVSLKVLPDFFADKIFYIGTDLSQNTTSMLQRYIIAYKGNVTDEVEKSEYIITESSHYKENVISKLVLFPDWIWECSDQKKLIPTDHYLV